MQPCRMTNAEGWPPSSQSYRQGRQRRRRRCCSCKLARKAQAFELTLPWQTWGKIWSCSLRVLDDGIMALEPRIQGAEREMPKLINRTTEKLVQLQRQLETGIGSLEPRLVGLELEPWRCKVKDLEAKVVDLEATVVHLPGRVVDLEAQAKSAETWSQELESEQKILMNKLRKREESAEVDGEAWREQLRIRSDALDTDLRQVRADLLKHQEDQTSELQRRLEARLADVETRLAEEEAQLNLGLQKTDRVFSQRLDDNQTALDRQSRALTLLQHSRQEQDRALEGLKRHVEEALQQEKDAFEKEKVALQKEKGTLEKAVAHAEKMAEQTTEVSRQLMSQHAEREAALLRRFEGWSLEAQEEAASKVLAAQEASVRDLLQEIDRRSAESEGKLAKIRIEVGEALQSTSGKCEARLGDLRHCFTSFAAEAAGSIGEMSTHIERMRQRTDSASVLHDSTMVPSSITVANSFRVQGSSALPGLQELRAAVAEEMRTQEDESRRLQERLQDFGVDGTVNPSSCGAFGMRGSRSAGPSGRSCGTVAILEGLRGCEVAITTLDRRVTSLEDCVEDKLYDIVRGNLSRSQALQKSHLLEMESKVDKLVHQLHTPSGFQAASQGATLALQTGDREIWRKQFRSALGDSLYVKRALAKSNRSCSADTLR
eukprot:TRINITY_DN9249_c0_g4_i1.p1 TRINITY_DN9249_c0_g4~~TRINITY_DN9249_c0_g4_i1.p1  ORF type:complete len:659 (+),score=163.99 TRINITY_DN9249_c0_g4_i1:531-2507(+)